MMNTTLFIPPRCADCGDFLPHGWPVARCRACQEWGPPIDIEIDDINDPSAPPESEPAPGRMPAIQQAFLAWETRRLLSMPEYRQHILDTAKRWMEEDEELWGAPGEPIWKEAA